MALRIERFSQGLQLEHEARVVPDKQAYLVDIETETVLGIFLGVQPVKDFIGEVVNRELVVLPIFRKQVVRHIRSRCLGQCQGNVVLLPCALGALVFPPVAGDSLKGFFELSKLAIAIQVTLETSNERELAGVTAALVEDFREHAQDGIRAVLLCNLFGDVEKQIRGRHIRGLLKQPREERVPRLGDEALDDLRSVKVDTSNISEQVRKHFEHVRFTRAEEAGNPDSVRVFVVRVRLEETGEVLLNLVREDVFFDLDPQMRVVGSPNNAIDRTGYVLDEDVAEFLSDGCHRSRFLVKKIAGAVVAVVMKSTEEG